MDTVGLRVEKMVTTAKPPDTSSYVTTLFRIPFPSGHRRVVITSEVDAMVNFGQKTPGLKVGLVEVKSTRGQRELAKETILWERKTILQIAVQGAVQVALARVDLKRTKVASMCDVVVCVSVYVPACARALVYVWLTFGSRALRSWSVWRRWTPHG